MSVAHLKNTYQFLGDLPEKNQTDLQLQLYVNLKCLRYFILQKETVFFYGEHSLFSVFSNSDLQNQLENIFSKDVIFDYQFSKIVCFYDAPFQLVPNSFLETKNKETTELVCNQEVGFVREQNKEIEEAFRMWNSSVIFAHSGAGFIEAIYKQETSYPSAIYVNLSAEYVDILVFKEGKKLHYFNRFIYQTETDFIYYLLLVCDELKINREQVYLVFSGEVNINSKLYDIAFRYFLHISFFKSSSSIVFAKAFDTFPKHLHLFLYSSYADYLP